MIARTVFCAAVVASFVALSGCPLPPAVVPPGSPTIAVQVAASGFVSPVAFKVPPDGSGRRFVVDQVGQILVLDAGDTAVTSVFLDVSGRLVALSPLYDERGLLGLAFHPDYATNGRFFVFYNGPRGGDTPAEFASEVRISEFRVSADDPNRGDSDSERVLLRIGKPQANHNGGAIAFGPDGYLYLGIGDGGGGNDVGSGHTPGLGNGQDKTALLGKVLRIDVDTGDPYAIPADNPFASDPGARGEIYALGLRNPWRFSFDIDDSGQARLFVADVGQDLFEEVDLVQAGGNYGWNLREGTRCFDPANPRSPPAECAEVDADGRPLIDPIIAYPHSAEADEPFGVSAIGGYVYRGDAIPSLLGAYVFGDLSVSSGTPDGSLFLASEGTDGSWSLESLRVADRTDGRIGAFILAFGRDEAGELYVLTADNVSRVGRTGVVYKIIPAP